MSQMQVIGANMLLFLGVGALFTGFVFTVALAIEGTRWAQWVMIGLVVSLAAFGLLAMLGAFG